MGWSLHFWRARREELRRFVTAHGATGRIFASNERWICFVPFDRDDEPKLLTLWEGIAMKWLYAEDYGLGLECQRSGKTLGEVSFIWAPMLPGQKPGAKFPAPLRSELVALNVLSGADAADLERTGADVAGASISGSTVRDRVAAILGLAAFAWLSPETCLQVGLEDTREEYPYAEDIGLT